MLQLLQLSRAAARSSCGKCKPPNWKLGSRVPSTTWGDFKDSLPRLRCKMNSQQVSSIRPWQEGATRGGFHLQQHVTVPWSSVGTIRSEASGVQGVYSRLHSGKDKLPLGLLLLQRNCSGSGLSLRFTKKDVSSWLRRYRGNNLWGRFSGSRVRHYGGGTYVDPQLALGALIAANVGVFFLWRTVGGRFMESHFVVSMQALREGRLHTLVTSIFSQCELQHLLSNMIGLYFFGSEIGNLFGGQRLILLYLTGGIVGSLTHLVYWSYIKPWVEGYPRGFSPRSPGLLGSSGAVNAIILLDILLFPNRIIYLNFIIPVPAALVGLVIIGSDLWAATAGSKTGTSPAAHLGGALVGALAYLRWR
ncbi:unnamed protein product [Calypogeia fissa]